MTEVSQHRRKRSRSIAVTTLMASAAVAAGCDTSTPANQWSTGSGQDVEVAAYSNLAECTSAKVYTVEQCNAAYAEAAKDNEANAPKFADAGSCEAQYGVGQCVPRSQAGGGSSFMPLLAGFMIGQALGGGGGYGYRGAPLYRDREEAYGGGGGAGGGLGGYRTRTGEPVGRDYVTGRTRVGSDAFDAPARVQSRSAVISRGGFGGGGRSYGG